MAFEVPSAEELKTIRAREPYRADRRRTHSVAGMMPGADGDHRADRCDHETPQDSVTRYRDRKAGVRPSPKDDPLNAIVTRCSVKGAASGPLKGKRVGVKDSVCVAGIPASGGSSVLKGHVAASDATIVGADARRGRGNRRDAEHGRLRAVRRRPHQLLRTGAQSAQPGILRGRLVVRLGGGALL